MAIFLYDLKHFLVSCLETDKELYTIVKISDCWKPAKPALLYRQPGNGVIRVYINRGSDNLRHFYDNELQKVLIKLRIDCYYTAFYLSNLLDVPKDKLSFVFAERLFNETSGVIKIVSSLNPNLE